MSNLSIFGRTGDIFDDFFDGVMRPFGSNVMNSQMIKTPASRFGVMSTDIEDNGDSITISMNIPGYSKEDIKVELEDGIMTVSASKVEETTEDAPEKNFIRRERYVGSCSRTFEVGDSVTEEDIKASHKDGVLTIVVPKKSPEIENKKKIITIE